MTAAFILSVTRWSTIVTLSWVVLFVTSRLPAQFMRSQNEEASIVEMPTTECVAIFGKWPNDVLFNCS
jgi:hypothetical protein